MKHGSSTSLLQQSYILMGTNPRGIPGEVTRMLLSNCSSKQICEFEQVSDISQIKTNV